MFDALAMGMITKQTDGQVTPQMYDINTSMDGKQYIYGVQLGLSYKINDWLSVFAGGRMNYFTGGYEGYLKTELKNDYTQIGQMMGLPDGKHWPVSIWTANKPDGELLQSLEQTLNSTNLI